MTLYATSALLALFTFGLLGPASAALAQARWVVRAPKPAVALWQTMGISALVSAIGAALCLAVARFQSGLLGGLAQLTQGAVEGRPLAGMGLPDALGLTLAADLGVVLVFLVVFLVIRSARVRAHHRRLVDLLSHSVEGMDIAVLDDPRAVAYCIPGVRPRIVVSAGTVDLLNPAELAAVVEHERGHASEKHGLVLLPVVGLRRIFGFVPYAQHASTSVARLLEMAADDYASRRHGRRALADALVAMATAGTPPHCSLAVNGGDTTQRVERLLRGSSNSRAVGLTAGLACALVLAVPISLLCVV
jgi:Zn-dependent protease with chaperone function